MYLNSAPGLPGFCWNWGDSKIEQNDKETIDCIYLISILPWLISILEKFPHCYNMKRLTFRDFWSFKITNLEGNTVNIFCSFGKKLISKNEMRPH